MVIDDKNASLIVFDDELSRPRARTSKDATGQRRDGSARADTRYLFLRRARDRARRDAG